MAVQSLTQLCSTVALSVSRQMSKYEESSDPNDLDFLVFKVVQLHKCVVALGASDSLLEEIGQCLSILTNMQDSSVTVVQSDGYSPETIISRGRPKFAVCEQQLQHLLQLGFDCPTIASVLGVSLRTVRRRMSEFGLSVSSVYTSISDADLESAVQEVKVLNPNCGYRMLTGHLRSRGIRVSQERIREMLHRTDPCGSVIRWASTISRRRYKVASQLSLWHTDGNHKLIR